jgi:hypothetical protein
MHVNQWIAMEHYRLHTVEEWPASPYKDATLAAIYSSLEGLSRYVPHGGSPHSCETCRGLAESRDASFEIDRAA